MSQVHSIQYGSKTIQFELHYAERKSLNIKVFPEGTVKVIAPSSAKLIEVKQKLSTKAIWINKQLTELKKYNPKTPKRKYINGETHLYLGRQYRLKIIHLQKGKSQIHNYTTVRVYRGMLEVFTNVKSARNIELVINDFYHKKAMEIISPMFNEAVKSNKKFNKLQPLLKLQPLKKQWGLCTKAGKITINTELIKAPKACIEYVILHELCHLVHFNHKKEFYLLLGKLFPDWEKWKDKLEMVMV